MDQHGPWQLLNDHKKHMLTGFTKTKSFCAKEQKDVQQV